VCFVSFLKKCNVCSNSVTLTTAAEACRCDPPFSPVLQIKFGKRAEFYRRYWIVGVLRDNTPEIITVETRPYQRYVWVREVAQGNSEV
jgi:hypothetical protein